MVRVTQRVPNVSSRCSSAWVSGLEKRSCRPPLTEKTTKSPTAIRATSFHHRLEGNGGDDTMVAFVGPTLRVPNRS